MAEPRFANFIIGILFFGVFHKNDNLIATLSQLLLMYAIGYYRLVSYIVAILINEDQFDWSSAGSGYPHVKPSSDLLDTNTTLA